MSRTMTGAPRLLHLFPRFSASEPAAVRAVAVMNGLGGRMQHLIVSADRGARDAAHGLDKGIGYTLDSGFPQLGGMPTPGRLQRIARRMTGFDLVLTYGRGALPAVLAHTLFGEALALPPLIHHDDGSDESDKDRRSFRSLWYRRVGLGKSSGLVVPTEAMEGVALTAWRQPMGRVKLIRDAVDPGPFGGKVRSDAIPRLVKRPGEKWALCFAAQAEPWSLRRMIVGFDRLPYEWQLILVGGGEDHPEISLRSLDDRVHAAPAGAAPATLLALADMVLQPAQSDPLPRETLWALAAGRPLAGYGGEDITGAASPDNARFLLPPAERYDPSEGMRALADDDALRNTIGEANRAKAQAERDPKAMIGAYRRLYESAIERGRV